MLVSRRFFPPRDPAAEPVCLLTKEWAARRREPVDTLLTLSNAQLMLVNGIEYRFPLSTGIGQRIDTFIAEEAECCPFLAFETFEEAGDAVLRITQPAEDT